MLERSMSMPNMHVNVPNNTVDSLNNSGHLGAKQAEIIPTNELANAVASRTENAPESKLKDKVISFVAGALNAIREITAFIKARFVTPNIGTTLNSLSESNPNIGKVVQGLAGFIGSSAIQWHEKNVGNPENEMDAGAQSRFYESLIRNKLNEMNDTDVAVMLEQLEGDFGQRLRSVLTFAAEKVPMARAAQKDELLISKSNALPRVTESLITELRERLRLPSEQIKDIKFIDSVTELDQPELAALKQVGFTEKMLIDQW
ncbi:hypothetical protein [Vibrio sagamiensis]|uniref:Uncharacterized protein n=1 Tax=Vibrio sagamiensis NBRC 104589 TaxID=1219064 RepID=A0A511QL21_9VIBR|nr:hypothetical protein [Vibrio sagamiensis]PNQ54036.1 hypothetical protein C1141_18030 [Vibrio agarivorans]GEM77726.1 hypothetical protein VSA01S_38380 [Vibrio sagamiensis NBRC 104589]